MYYHLPAGQLFPTISCVFDPFETPKAKTDNYLVRLIKPNITDISVINYIKFPTLYFP